METIRNYIDNLFRNYPHTPKVQRAREELLGIMEDKYNELKAQGRSENEAIGIVISEFGNMDEIAQELESDGDSSPSYNEERSYTHNEEREYTEYTYHEESKGEEGVYAMDLSQVKEYISWQISFGYSIALGVALCILSPSAAALLEALATMRIIPYRVSDTLGGLALILMVAVGVGIFITKGIASGHREEKIAGRKIWLEPSARAYVESEMEAYTHQFGISIAAGVILCILSVMPAILIGGLAVGIRGLDELAGVLLFVLVACGVACFITAGIRRGAYETLLGNGKMNIRNKNENKVMNIISPIYWLTVTGIYLWWSFWRSAWGFSWIIWPFAGIAFGIIAVIVKAVTEKEEGKQ